VIEKLVRDGIWVNHAVHIEESHALDTGSDTSVNNSCLDLGSDNRASFNAARALSVDGSA
jgi:hypothetical protein